MQEKNHMSIHDKNSQVRNRSELCHLDKGHLQQTYSQHYIYSERLNVFPVRLRSRQGCPQSTLLCSTALKVLTIAVRQERKIDLPIGIERGKKEIIKVLFTNKRTV